MLQSNKRLGLGLLKLCMLWVRSTLQLWLQQVRIKLLQLWLLLQLFFSLALKPPLRKTSILLELGRS